jgi:hypothetical protein
MINFNTNKMFNFQYEENKLPSENCEIYCKTGWLDRCLILIQKNSQYEYILYSGGSDCTIEYDYNKTFAIKINEVPDNIRYWKAQNCNILHPKIKLVPIGVNPQTKDILLSIVPFENKKDDVYFNCSSWSNPIRLNMKNLNKKLPAKEYFEEMTQYKYVACPRGLGIDTYRIWEAIHLGCIPILEKSNFSKMISEKYKIIEINSFKDL